VSESVWRTLSKAVDAWDGGPIEETALRSAAHEAVNDYLVGCGVVSEEVKERLRAAVLSSQQENIRLALILQTGPFGARLFIHGDYESRYFGGIWRFQCRFDVASCSAIVRSTGFRYTEDICGDTISVLMA